MINQNKIIKITFISFLQWSFVPLQQLCLCYFHYLLNIRVQLEYLTLPLNLSHADLTGELRHGQAASLQAEGAV